MKIDYDLFEVLPDGNAVWRACAQGSQNALEMLRIMGTHTLNPCFAADLGRNEIIGHVNDVRDLAQIIYSPEQRDRTN